MQSIEGNRRVKSRANVFFTIARLDTIAVIVVSGVDYVLVGRLMQSAPAANIGLDFELV
jgi:nicotinate-nucleotide pyrophosphorylase